MGQYYLVCNVDRREYLHPHHFGDGLKLMEFGSSGCGTMLGLAVLLADGNNRGGGDLRSNHRVIGSWRGDRIVVAGDYADAKHFVPEDLREEAYRKELADQLGRDGVSEEQAEDYARGNMNLFHVAEHCFKNVSGRVLSALAEDSYVRSELQTSLKWRQERLPKKLREKVFAPVDENFGAGEPPHVKLARMVLRSPDDATLWRVFVDACYERC
jgi:hypothetical protein